MVSIADGFAACAANVPVTIQLKRSARWGSIKTIATSESGVYKTAIPKKKGTYRAIASTVETQTDICQVAASKEVVR